MGPFAKRWRARPGRLSGRREPNPPRGKGKALEAELRPPGGDRSLVQSGADVSRGRRDVRKMVDQDRGTVRARIDGGRQQFAGSEGPKRGPRSVEQTDRELPPPVFDTKRCSGGCSALKH